MNEDAETLKILLQYYRNKCAQLEFDFVLYKIHNESKFKESWDGADVQVSSNEGKESNSNAKNS